MRTGWFGIAKVIAGILSFWFPAQISLYIASKVPTEVTEGEPGQTRDQIIFKRFHLVI